MSGSVDKRLDQLQRFYNWTQDNEGIVLLVVCATLVLFMVW